MPLLAILLTAVFVTLKLCGVIAWGWFFVLLPLFLMAALWLAVVAVIGLSFAFGLANS